MPIKTLFATQIYMSPLLPRSPGQRTSPLHRALETEISQIQKIDHDGHEWCRKNSYLGYTSYGSMDQLHRSSPNFQELMLLIQKHVRPFVKTLELDTDPRDLRMNSCWVNVMPKHSHHSTHIHPLAVISGTYYVKVPSGAAALKFEDPRLIRMMASPSKKPNAHEKNRTHVAIEPKAGDLVLFESWLGHEVPTHTAREERVSISFNFASFP